MLRQVQAKEGGAGAWPGTAGGASRCTRDQILKERSRAAVATT